MDKSEEQLFIPIIEEAKKRGYRTTLTKDKFARCEIGFYCQHLNFPQFSKFSVIMLHDIIQGFSRWPDIWYEEPWHKYDLGVLPGKMWSDMWTESSGNFYLHPRRGVFEIGWPKADIIAGIDINQIRKDLFLKYGLDLSKKTILYAPAWENDGKQNDFVQAMKGLDVNILIKQAALNPDIFPEIVKNIKIMYELHRDEERVTILEPEVNILYAIAMADILVSDESSTMCEAVMMGKPAVSVSDWLIPDVTPSRYPQDNYTFVTKTQKVNLESCVRTILDSYSDYANEASQYSRLNFRNIGNSSEIIMDIIDSIVNDTHLPLSSLKTNKRVPLKLINLIRFQKKEIKKEFLQNYCERYVALRLLKAKAKQVLKIDY